MGLKRIVTIWIPLPASRDRDFRRKLFKTKPHISKTKPTNVRAAGFQLQVIKSSDPSR